MPKEPKHKAITHTLKCWPEFYEAICAGIKTFEYRVNDRDYQVGDRLRLREFVPCEACKGTGRIQHTLDSRTCHCTSGHYPKGKYTGCKILRDVTYKLVTDEMVILSIVKLPPKNKTKKDITREKLNRAAQRKTSRARFHPAFIGMLDTPPYTIRSHEHI